VSWDSDDVSPSSGFDAVAVGCSSLVSSWGLAVELADAELVGVDETLGVGLGVLVDVSAGVAVRVGVAASDGVWDGVGVAA
jgi:hypothetical protein